MGSELRPPFDSSPNIPSTFEAGGLISSPGASGMGASGAFDSMAAEGCPPDHRARRGDGLLFLSKSKLPPETNVIQDISTSNSMLLILEK